MALRIVAILLLVLANAFFVAAEFAIVRARRPRLEALAREGDRLATLALRAATATARTLAACELGITLSSFGIGWILAGLLRHLLGAGSGWRVVASFTAGAAVAVYLQLVFGELTPRAAALARPEFLARVLAPPLLAFTWISRPLTAAVSASFQRINQRIRARVPAVQSAAAHSPDELRLLVEQSEEIGALDEHDADLLEGVFEFSEKSAREVMTPRTELVAVATDASLAETLATVEESGFTRIPVFEGTIDNIVGVLLAKDLLPLAHRAPERFSPRDVMRPVHVIPGTREVEDVLADFKRLKEHMAVVLDEYGGTAGIVTMEDLLEEIVGEIYDEYDVGAPAAVANRSGEIVLPGEKNIGELNEELGLAVPDTEFTTIGGYIFGSLGRLPRAGDSVSAGGGVFTVRSMDGRAVGTVAVRLMSTG